MSSPSILTARGTVIGTGAALNVRTVGFRPRRVTLHSVGDEMFWEEGMADASAYKRVAGGTGTLATSNGITPLSDGFTIGADADVNGSGDVIRWEAQAE